MKRKLFTLCMTALLMILMISAAAADSITLNGKTVPAETIQICAPVSGRTEQVLAETGRQIQAEDILYTMKTNRIYADRDGTVAGIFGQPGDDAETVAARYGAVLYLEENPAYTVNASTSNAYNSLKTKRVHTGETIWVISRTNTARTGKGRITSVSGTSYTAEITEGEFLAGESVDLYRNETHDYEQKIGRGTVSCADPAAVTATGAIVKITVKDGDEVRRGDLLLETLDGTYDAYAMQGTEIPAGRTGVVGSILAEAGASVEKGSVVAEIYPLDRMRVEASIPEDYCNQVKEGEPVTIELVTDLSKSYPGTIVMISSVASEGEEEVSYRVVAEFVPDEAVRFGMSALITAGQEDNPEIREEQAEKTEAAETVPAEESSSGKRERRERPEGMPERDRPGERTENEPETEVETDEGKPGETQE